MDKPRPVDKLWITPRGQRHLPPPAHLTKRGVGAHTYEPSPDPQCSSPDSRIPIHETGFRCSLFDRGAALPPLGVYMYYLSCCSLSHGFGVGWVLRWVRFSRVWLYWGGIVSPYFAGSGVCDGLRV